MSGRRSPLGEIAKVGAGNSAPQGDHLFSSDGLPFFRTSDVGRVRFGVISQSLDRLNEEGCRGLRLLPKGTILFPKSGASTFLNHRVLLDVHGFVSSHLATIVADESIVLPTYLLYFLATIKAQDLVQDHAYPSLNLPVIAGIPVPVPPLEEQHRIVALLDEAFAGIAIAKTNVEKNLRNARDLFDVARSQIFVRLKAALRRLGDVTEVQSGGTPTVSSKHYWGDGIPWYSSGELNNFFTSDPERTISTQGLNESNAKLFPTGALLIGMYDTAALKMSILDREAAFNQAIAGAKPTVGLDTSYLLHAISAQKEELLGQRRGVRQKNLSLGKIKDIAIPLPSIDVQKEIVGELHEVADEIARLESLYTRKLAALDELKQSLLQRAFSGAL